ncbi:signal peptide protein [Rhodopirellula sallentina SM41]|uniref:Signal peptide protein n=1 Tax=Rhodopirellula sallentina SM41 TaxID=1263870 RepID=M5U192_9BACT|nr:signal peptide protein [Rhodopirellula sallentina SM41]
MGAPTCCHASGNSQATTAPRAHCCQSSASRHAGKTSSNDSRHLSEKQIKPCDCFDQSQCDCEIRAELTDGWISSRVINSDDQTVVADMPIGLLAGWMIPPPNQLTVRQFAPSRSSALTSKDHCALLCRWLN